MKRPQRKIIGKRKKLENVWASKTSFTETAINRPIKVEVIEINKILIRAGNQLIPETSVKKTASNRGTRALKIPNTIAPAVLANIRIFKSIGAKSRRSKEACFFSKVIVTASMEVVPKRIDKETKPGRTSRILSGSPLLRKNIRAQATGNTKPQLILGGFK